MSTVTVCPAKSARLVLAPAPQFSKEANIGGATFDAHGEATTSGLSFGDYINGMQTQKRSSGRCAAIPAYMFDSDALQEVITVSVELRAQIYQPSKGMSRQARLDRAQKMLLARRPGLIRQIETACARYMAARSAGEPWRALESRVVQLDRQLQSLERTPQIIAAVLYLSYRIGLNSPQVSAVLHEIVSPPGVRQILHRAAVIGKKIENGVPFMPTPGKRKKPATIAPVRIITHAAR